MFNIIFVQEIKVKFSELMSLARILVTMLRLCSNNDKMLDEFKESVIVQFTDNKVNYYL